MESPLLDAAGHRGSPATTPGYHHGRCGRERRPTETSHNQAAGARRKVFVTLAFEAVTSMEHRNLPVASACSPALAAPAVVRRQPPRKGVLSATEEFGDPIVGSSDLRHELPDRFRSSASRSGHRRATLIPGRGVAVCRTLFVK